MAALIALPAAAEVTISEAGFAITNEAIVPAPAGDVWAALILPSTYWNPEHGYSGNAEAYPLEPVADGCFCEILADGGSVEHMRVIMVMPNRMLRLSGALGPLQSKGLASALTWELEHHGEGTRIIQTYMVGGYMPAFEAETIAPPVDGVVNEQLQRLAALFAPETD